MCWYRALPALRLHKAFRIVQVYQLNDNIIHNHQLRKTKNKRQKVLENKQLMAKYMGQTMSIPSSTKAPIDASTISRHQCVLELRTKWMKLISRPKLICPQIHVVSVDILFSRRELRCELFRRI